MGQEPKKEQVNVQISDKRKRDYLIEIISSFLKTNIALMEYYHAVAPTRKAKFVCNKSIKRTENAIAHLRQIKHVEILDYLYSSFIGNNAIAYSVSGGIVVSKQLAYFDSDKGFGEFQQMVKEQREKEIAKEQERIRTQEAIKKAKEQGKKVEMVWDNETKKAKPVIVDEPSA